MDLRPVQECDKIPNTIKADPSAFIARSHFIVDGFPADYAACFQQGCFNQGMFHLSQVWIAWNDGKEDRLFILLVGDKTTANLVLSSLGSDISSQALTALGFLKV